MKGKGVFSLVMVAVFVLSLGAAMAASFSPDGHDRKGKYLYRKNCFKTCHDGSQAKEINPNSKTQAQWQRVFKRYERVECAEEWKEFSHADLNDIYTYLYKHAYDSPQPATCE
jgi:hypothetical protein